MQGISKKSAANHLFMVHEQGKLLPEDKGYLFYNLVAKLLYLCRRTYQEIKMAVEF